jgi:hypothetical protein
MDDTKDQTVFQEKVVDDDEAIKPKDKQRSRKAKNRCFKNCNLIATDLTPSINSPYS